MEVVWDTQDDTLVLGGSHGLRDNQDNTVSSFPPLNSLISIQAQVYNFQFFPPKSEYQDSIKKKIGGKGKGIPRIKASLTHRPLSECEKEHSKGSLGWGVCESWGRRQREERREGEREGGISEGFDPVQVRWYLQNYPLGNRLGDQDHGPLSWL